MRWERDRVRTMVLIVGWPLCCDWEPLRPGRLEAVSRDAVNGPGLDKAVSRHASEGERDKQERERVEVVLERLAVVGV